MVSSALSACLFRFAIILPFFFFSSIMFGHWFVQLSRNSFCVCVCASDDDKRHTHIFLVFYAACEQSSDGLQARPQRVFNAYARHSLKGVSLFLSLSLARPLGTAIVCICWRIFAQHKMLLLLPLLFVINSDFCVNYKWNAAIFGSADKNVRGSDDH